VLQGAHVSERIAVYGDQVAISVPAPQAASAVSTIRCNIVATGIVMAR